MTLYVFFITYAVPKTAVRCYIQNPSPRSDLQTFDEKNKKSCFEMTLYAFFITYAVPKAAVRCYIKTLPPPEVTCRHFMKKKRNQASK